MYQHTTSSFGRFERHTFFNEKINCGFSIVPEYGVVLMDTIFYGKNVLDGFATPEELEKQKWGKSIVLYPFPNRMHDGTYTHEGKTYHFPIDNAATNNAIHGFGKKMAHEINAMILADDYVSVTCVNEYDGHLPYYPFPCRFEITFTFSVEDGMEIEMNFKNTGTTSIPVGIGWHPYFSISEQIEDVSMQLGALEWIDIDERMLPTGKKTPYQKFQHLEKIGDTNLDNGFKIVDESKNFEVVLETDGGVLFYWQVTGERKYNFIQIFTPPHRNCIALEPMTSNIDAFNNKDGLVILQANENLGGKFGYNYSKNK